MIFFGFGRRRKADKLLARGELRLAIELYKKEKAWDALMTVHEGQGDMMSAAQAAEKAELYERAAQLYEKAGAFKQAAEIWLRINEKERAAGALERAEDFEAAIDLYTSINMPSRAAGALAAMGRYVEAAGLYEQAGDLPNVLRMREAADQPEEMARVYEQMGDLEEAGELYYKAGNKVKAAELFAKTDRLVQSARCRLELGDHKKAGDLLVSAEHLLAAAEAYEKDRDTLGKSAEIFRKVLRSEVVWQKEAAGPIICLDISEYGDLVALGAARKVRLFTGKGEPVWRFVPTWGGNPSCIALSREGNLAIGCDDGYVYFLDKGKNVLWTRQLPGKATKISISPSGECIVCATSENFLVCLDAAGERKWDCETSSITWDVAVSPDGGAIAAGGADGSCTVMTSDGRPLGKYEASKWVHSVSLGEGGTRLAVATGMHGVELIDGQKFERIWSRYDGSPVHNVVLTPQNSVLSVGDEEALLRDEAGSVIWRCSAGDRLLGGDIDMGLQAVVLRCAGKNLLRVDLHHCRTRAAANFAEARHYGDAAVLYEQMQEFQSAARMFTEAGEYANAARNIEIAGLPLEAAELYERAEDFVRAAHLFEMQGQLAKSASCFMRAGQTLKAAELFVQAGDQAKAAELFEQAEEYGRAGELYKAAGDVPGAMNAFMRHVGSHPDDWKNRFELGLLLQADGQYDQAMEHFQQTALIDECRRESVMHVAECFMGKDEYEIAVERYSACLEKGEGVSWANRDVYYGMGKAYQLAGNYPEAKRVYEGILAIDFRYEDVAERLADVVKLSSVFGRGATPSRESPAVTVAAVTIADQAFQELPSEKKERYVPIRKLGEGGMGTVYLAEDKRLNRKVALKMLAASLRADEKMRLRIIHEAQLIAQVVHPNVVSVFDVGEERGSSFVSMEYVEGNTAKELLAEKGVFKPQECVRLLLQIARGLSCAHGRGVCHRDIKPENIMVTADGTAKIMDFGLALVEGATRFTMPGQISGTPLYMAPEQLRGDDTLTPAVDIYAVGCLAYELLTGQPPFTEGNIASQHLNQPARSLREVDPQVPAPLEELVMKCLNKDSSDRYPDGDALLAALEEVERAL